MIIPKQVTVGRTLYTVLQKETLPYYRRGCISYRSQTIEIARRPVNPKAAAYRDTERCTTFWHEVTHAILYDMGHRLWSNEDFVTQFSTRLSKAIRTARL